MKQQNKKKLVCFLIFAIVLGVMGFTKEVKAAIFPISLSVTPDKLGTGWELQVSGGFFPTYSIIEAVPHIVAVGLSDGTFDQFSFGPVPSSQVLYPPQFVNGAFYPLSGALGSLSPPVQSPDLWFINNSELMELDSFEIYDPEYYWYALDTEIYKLPKGYSAIPVPTTILLLGSGLVGLAVTRKKIKRR